jgi:hypothetical protein
LQVPITDGIVLEDENVEVLFDDELVIVSGAVRSADGPVGAKLTFLN